MFCPQCGSTQSDELKFCKSCGANLQALRQVMATRDTDEKFDWNNTWLAEMFRTEEDAIKHQAQIDRLRGITPEIRRQREIKAGVITASVGLGLMILLFVLMNGIVATGRVSDAAAEILMRLWVVGIIPILVGAALIFNGVFVSKPAGGLSPAPDPEPNRLGQNEPEAFLPPADTNELFPAGFSVTDETTKHLKQPVKRRE